MTTTNDSPLAEMIGIRKSFAGQAVLRGVDFDVRPGEVHVLAGENGAGKSTLIRILGGVLRADAGEVRVGGRSAGMQSAQDAAAAGIAVIHQELSLCPSLSVAENVLLGREPVGRLGSVREREAIARAEAALRRVGLDVDPRRRAGTLGLAARQLVEIAKALSMDARVIVMDEPTSSLAREDVERLFSLIDGLVRGDPPAGVVFISHRLEEIARVADRVTVLRDGERVLGASAPDCPSDVLIRAMVGRTLEDQIRRVAPEPGRSVLRAHGLTVGGRDSAGVRDVSLRVRAGEVLGLAGVRGSGVSNLLHGLFGDGSVRAGEIEIDGDPFRARTPRGAARARIALVTGDRQALGVCPHLSVEENVTLASLDAITRGGFVSDRLAATCAREGVASLGVRCASIAQPVATLSGGNQQKVILARWMLTEPVVMLLDDPTRGVDIAAKHEIYELINRWTAGGMGVLLASTDLPELIGMSDRILVLHRGRVTAELSRDEATPERVIGAAMGETRGAA